jgi:hypothetical protein
MNEYPYIDPNIEIQSLRHTLPEPQETDIPDPVNNGDYIYWAHEQLWKQYRNKSMNTDQYIIRLQLIKEWSADDNS